MKDNRSILRVIYLALGCTLTSCGTDEPDLLLEDTMEPPVFEVVKENPVLKAGDIDDWDSQLVFLPEVVKYNEKYYMYYTATKDLINVPLAIGVATSSDGKSWKKYGTVPLLTGENLEAFAVASARIIIEDNHLVMYFNMRTTPGPGPGAQIARAVAKTPEGPWSITNTSVLTTGGDDAWDKGFISPSDILKVDGVYYLFYSAGTAYVPAYGRDHRHQLGLATSTDGIHFEKHNDPGTNETGYIISDPILPVGPAGSYDSGMAWEASVLNTTFGFEMFYTSDPDSFTGERICYATSTDGKQWLKDPDNPILEDKQSWVSHDLVVGSVMREGGEYTLYYSGLSGLFEGSIGMAIGSKTP